MDNQQILTADLLDIIFEGRNKMYGAYELRKTYNKRIALAFLFTALIVTLFYSGYFMATKMKVGSDLPVVIDDYHLQEVDIKPKEEVVVIPKAKNIEKPQVQQIKIATPVIVANPSPE